MRIAYVINSVEGGGAALPVPALAQVLRSEGIEVIVVALERRDGRALAPMRAAGLEVRVRDGSRADHAMAMRWLDRVIADVRPSHIWTSLTRATLLGQLVGAWRRLPVVSWQHHAWLRPGNLRLLRLMRRASALWVADSTAVARFTHDALGVPDARIATWPIFRADPGAPRAAAWQPGERLRLGSLGRLHPNKGYDLLDAALAGLPPLDVAIAGDGKAPPPGRRLRLTGFADDPARFLAGLHLYLQPSRSEGFCIAAHEAMAAGLPVIASAVGALADDVVPGVTGWLVPPDDVAELRAAIAEAVAAPDRLATMGAAGQEAVIARYGPDRFAAAGRAVVGRLRAL